MAYSRKLQKIGGSMFISLPKLWVTKMRLDKSDIVKLVELPDGSLSMSREADEGSIEEMTLAITSNDKKETLTRKIVGLYVDGIDIIKLQSKNKFNYEQYRVIRDITESLFGLEIIETTSDQVTIQCLLTNLVSTEKMTQRIHSILMSIFKEILSALEGEKNDFEKDIFTRTYDVKRLSLVLHRLFRSIIIFPYKRKLDRKPIDSVDFLRIIDKISEISKNMSRMVRTISHIKRPIPNTLLQPLLRTVIKVINAYDYSIRSVIFDNTLLANSVLDEKLEPEFNDLLDILIKTNEQPNSDSSTILFIQNIYDSLQHLYINSTEIAEIAIDRALKIK